MGEGGGEQGEEVLSPGPGKGAGTRAPGQPLFRPRRAAKNAQKNAAKRAAAVRS